MPHQRNRREWRPGNAGGQRRGQSRGRGNGRQSYKPRLEVLELPRSHSNPFGFAGMSNDRPLPLPFDHPLKEELAEVRHQKEIRELYWAGLAQRIPEEMENPGSYDHQRWKEEKKLADAKIERLVSLIALAERGFPVARESSLPAHALPSQPPTQPKALGHLRNEAETSEKRNQCRPGKGARREGQEDYNPSQKGAARDDHQSSCRDIRRKGTVVWTEATRSEAFSKWMNELKPGFEHEDRPKVPLFICEDDGRGIHSLSDDDVGSSDGVVNTHTPVIRGANVGREAPQPVAWVGADTANVWSAQGEADFQEAEAERETQRYYMAFVMGIMALGAHTTQSVAKAGVSLDPRLRPSTEQSLAKMIVPEVPMASKMTGSVREVPFSDQLDQGTHVEHSKETVNEPQRLQQDLIPPTVEEAPLVQSVEIQPAEAVVNDENARKSDELLAALLEELSNPSWSSGPEEDLEPWRRPKPEPEPAMEAAPQIKIAEPEMTGLQGPVIENEKEPSPPPTLPVPEPEPAATPTVFAFDERKMRIMAAVAFASIQAKKRQMAADYMDIDIVKPIAVVNMHDVREGLEDGESTEAEVHHDISTNNGQTDYSRERAPVPLAGRVLYVGNLSFNATEEDLQNLFDSYQVESIIVPRDPHMRRPPGYAFVIMSSASEAESAIADSWNFHINQRTVTVRLGNLPKQYAATYELPKRVAENLGGNLLRTPPVTDDKRMQLIVSQPGATQVSEKQKADGLSSSPRYDVETVDAVERMLNNPGISLTDLNKSQRQIHLDYITEQQVKISKYKMRRLEGQILSAAQMKRVNREDDMARYEKELRRSLGIRW